MSDGLLNDEQGRYLLAVARHTIAIELGVSTPYGPGAGASVVTTSAPWLQESGATFVTLHTRSGALRGCIGSLVAQRPLIEDVQANARAAAFDDPRFPPLSAHELANIVIEVSVLTAPKPLTYDGGEELVEKLTPHVDGVVVNRGWHRATFLPQVWEQLPSVDDFLSHLCYKAGLRADAWQDGDLDVATYRVQEFREIPS